MLLETSKGLIYWTIVSGQPLSVVCFCLVAFSCEFSRPGRAVEAAEAVRLLGDRYLILPQRLGRSAQFQQQVAEQFSRRQEVPRHRDVLLGAVFPVGSRV